MGLVDSEYIFLLTIVFSFTVMMHSDHSVHEVLIKQCSRSLLHYKETGYGHLPSRLEMET